jgi:hypothetical protein|tara:strand:- start:62 stop:850 length:789 start_codon:yes stop_codon:yes gene_type:complete
MVKNIIINFFKFFSKKIVSLDSNIEDLKSLLVKLHPVKTDFELIRIGSDIDGGYLIPDDLDGISTCFSPGVSDNCAFELDLANNFGVTSYMCDWSVNSSPTLHDNLIFKKKYLGVINDEKYIRLESWFNTLKPKKDCILQMDIEGSEYNVILDTDNQTLSNFRILIIEFHGLDMLFNQSGFRTISSVFEKLLINFKVVHIHPNNCCGSYEYDGIEIPSVMEFTFLNKNRIKSFESLSKFPHKLDTDNTDNKTIELPINWYDS